MARRLASSVLPASGGVCAVAGAAGCWRGAGTGAGSSPWRMRSVWRMMLAAAVVMRCPAARMAGCGLGARVGAGPACRVRKLARDGDAVTGADDEGDGVGLGLADSRAAGGGCPGREAVAVLAAGCGRAGAPVPRWLVRRSRRAGAGCGGRPRRWCRRLARRLHARRRIPRGGPASTARPTARPGPGRAGAARPRGDGGCPVVCDRSQT